MSVVELAIIEISLVVNGIPVQRAVAPRTLLVDFLREDLGLTGTKVSCELQVCGVCTVLVDDRPTLSAGVRFTDAELIGIARSVVVGRRFNDGYAEIRDRRTGERHDVALNDVPGVIKKSLGYRTGNGREV